MSLHHHHYHYHSIQSITSISSGFRTLLQSWIALGILILVLKTTTTTFCDAQSHDNNPLTINGGSVLAMAGDGCVAIAVDQRFGSGLQLVTVQPRPVLLASPHVLVAFTGLEGDIQSLRDELSAHVASRQMTQQSQGLGWLMMQQDDDDADNNNNNNEKDDSKNGNDDYTMAALTKKRRRRRNIRNIPAGISPRAMNSLLSHILYGRRRAPYYVEPIVAGLDLFESDDNSDGVVARPFLCSQDLIGAKSETRLFCCAGAACQSLYGTAEALWEPNLSPERLVEICGKAFLSALERDTLSGYGAVVYLLTKDGIVEYTIAGRND